MNDADNVEDDALLEDLGFDVPEVEGPTPDADHAALTRTTRLRTISQRILVQDAEIFKRLEDI